MAGIIADIFMGGLGGAGKGISENAKGDIKNIYDQMNAQMKAEMEQRIAERGRKDDIARDERKHGYRLKEIEAEGTARSKAEREKKPTYPNIVKAKDDEGGEYLIDENSGAIGRPVAGSPGLPAKSHWFSEDEPAVPETKSGIVWTASDGSELPGGIAELYPQIKKPNAPSIQTKTKTPQGLPPGSKQIGTSGGKPVYQTPDGRKLIGD